MVEQLEAAAAVISAMDQCIPTGNDVLATEWARATATPETSVTGRQQYPVLASSPPGVLQRWSVVSVEPTVGRVISGGGVWNGNGFGELHEGTTELPGDAVVLNVSAATAEAAPYRECLFFLRRTRTSWGLFPKTTLKSVTRSC